MDDRFNLQRFVDAQRAVYDQVREELQSGSKRGHWMWFIFPQLEGLGSSATAKRFAISCREEAQAYVAHPVLGPRLLQCTGLVTGGVTPIEHLFSYPDDLKFRSSMTLFSQAAPEKIIFKEALEKYFAGQGCLFTMEQLGRA